MVDTRSYFYSTSSGMVRLTWQWEPVSGIRTAADYSIEDYAACGLKVHLGGLLNAGPDNAHSTTATKWFNLGSNGGTSNATLTKGNDESAWTSDGYYLDGKSKFTISSIGQKEGSSYTLQILSDVNRAAQQLDSGGSNQHDYLFSGAYNQFAVSVYGNGSSHFRAGDDVKFTLPDGERLTWFTGMMDQSGATPVAYAFPGTSTISDGTATGGDLTTPTSNNPALGGWGGAASQYLVGTIKNFRYYDRVLTEEELVRNRNVDSVRYFGELATTNVVYNGTAYKVEGKYTWTAPATVIEEGAARKTAGYWLETPDGQKTWHDELEFTYDTATLSDTVTLAWGGPRPGLLIIVR